MVAINKQDLINYLKKSPENINFNIFGTMLDDFRNTYETDEQIVDKIKNIIINIIEDGGSISPEDDTITELVDLITELLPEKMIIKPEGTLEIIQNGEYDVMNKAGVDVEVPLPSGTIQITQNGNTNVNDYEYANVQVPLPSGTVSITQNGTANVNDYEYANVNVVDPLGNLTRNNVTNLKLSEGPTNIENQTFKNCTNLEEITIPNSVTTLGSEAFSGCTNLTTVNGGFGVQNIGTNAFYNCPSILENGTTGDCKWAQYNGILTIDGNGNMANYSYSDSSPTAWKDNTKIIINNGVTNISRYAFNNCTNLANVMIPDSVTSIGDSAFEGCTGLTSVTIPDSVTSIGGYAFGDCSNLTSITFPDNVMNINQYAFLRSGWYDNQPDGVVYAGKMAYSYKGTMPYNASITLKDGTKGITENAFSSDRLKSVTIPDSVISIGDNAFQNCDYLTNATIGNGVTRIGKYAFAYCRNLTSIVVPDGTSIEWAAFAGCTGLTSITIPDNVTNINGNAFSGCTGLTSVTIPDNGMSISERMFDGCTNLTSITIPDSIAKIDSNAFHNTGWYNNQPDGLVYAGKVAYKYKGTMPSNTSITLQEGTKGIAGYAFYECTGLTNATIGNDVTSIGQYAFWKCNNLTSIDIPDSVTSVGANAFTDTAWDNNQPDGLVYAGKVAYRYKGTMPSNTSITLQEGTKEITDYAFANRTGLKSITIPDSVINIGERAIYNCINLTDVYYTGTQEEWNNISIGINNNSLTNATIHYNYTPSN